MNGQEVASWSYTISKAYWETCLGSSFPGKLRVHRVSCSSGHTVIRDYARKAQEQGPHITVDGFHCSAAPGIKPINCAKGPQRVTYSGGF